MSSPVPSAPLTVFGMLESLATEVVAEAVAPNAPPLEHRIHRRTWRTWPHLEGDAATAWTGGRRADETLGPFDDESGDRVYFDVYRRRFFVELSSPDLAESTALLGPLTPSDEPTVFRLEEGTVWLRARHLAREAPDGWCGVTASAGELRFDRPPTFDGPNPRLHGGGATIAITLASPPAAVGEAGVADDAAGSMVVLPTEIELRLDAAGLTITALADADLGAYGSTVHFEWAGDRTRYEPALASVVVPMRPSTDGFAFASAASTWFTPAAAAAVHWGGWALALTPASEVMGDASGAGQVMVALGDGATATSHHLSGPPASLHEVTVVAEPGRIGLLAPAATARRSRASHTLWSAHPGSRRRGGRIEVRHPSPFALRYLSVAGQGELVLAAADVTAHLDRPVRSDGRRFALPSTGGWLALHRDRFGDVLDLDGPLPIEQADADGVVRPIPRPSLALANALISTSTPRRLRIVGSMDPSGDLTVGSLGLDFIVYSVLPILPDPYVGNIDLSPLYGPSQMPRATVAVTVRWRGGDEENPIPQIHRIDGSLEEALLPSLRPSRPTPPTTTRAARTLSACACTRCHVPSRGGGSRGRGHAARPVEPRSTASVWASACPRPASAPSTGSPSSTAGWRLR